MLYCKKKKSNFLYVNDIVIFMTMSNLIDGEEM